MENKPYSIMVIAEGIKTPQGKYQPPIPHRRISELTGIEARETFWDIFRGVELFTHGQSACFRYGSSAAEMIARQEYGKRWH
jgi:6-phosphofructokinase 1